MKKLNKIQDIKTKYRIIRNTEDSQEFIVEIMCEPWAGVTYKYSNFSKKTEKEDDLVFEFEYEILTVPKELENKQFSGYQKHIFIKLINEILFDLFEEQKDAKI